MPKAPKEITPDQIVDQARIILEEVGQPVLLSWVGQELNRRLGVSIRSLLGQLPLSELLLRSFGDEYEVQGYGPYKEIGKRGTWEHSNSYRHFVRTFWDNFERPLEAGSRRWILPNSGGEAIDAPNPPEIDGAIEIDRHFIFDPAADQHKGRAVRQNITTWAKAHDVDLAEYEAKPKETLKTEDRRARPSGDAGTMAIRYMIEAVPPEDRGRYTISLDLLARLLNLE